MECGVLKISKNHTPISIYSLFRKHEDIFLVNATKTTVTKKKNRDHNKFYIPINQT